MSYDEMNHCSFIEIVFVWNEIRAGFSSAIILYYTLIVYTTPAARRRSSSESFFVFCFLFFCGHVKVDKTVHSNNIERRHNNNNNINCSPIPHNIFSATLQTWCQLLVYLPERPEPINFYLFYHLLLFIIMRFNF